MGFKENLQKKIKIDGLAKSIRKTIGPSDGTLRLDTTIMAQLLEIGGYPSHQERDLVLFLLEGDLDAGRILVLDNDIAIYRTSAEDIGLRKSPTIKEMVTFRNIKKILVDTDVVISRKEESLKTIQQASIDQLDLHFEPSDIEAIAADGQAAFERGDQNQVLNCLGLFYELLSFTPVPAPFRMKEFEITGKTTEEESGGVRLNAAVLYSPRQNVLKLIDDTISSLNKGDLERLKRIASHEEDATADGSVVFDILKELVLE